MSIFKDQMVTLEDVEQEYFYTPAGASEDLDLSAYPNYTTVLVNTAYACFVTLPWAQEAKGVKYTVRIIAGGTNEVTLRDKVGNTIIAFEDAGDYAVVESDGIGWNLLVSVEADG